VPILGIVDERRKVIAARAGVVGFGLVAYGLATNAEGVFALVEEASAFGSAGALVTAIFALFTRWGGPRAAIATLLTGMASYIAGNVAGVTAPYLMSLAVSLATYVGVAMAERNPDAGRLQTAR
jgi:Na+/proline symporter